MNALTKKAVKDVTRRKTRTILTVLGIAIGIMGLSAIGVATGQIQSSINYTTDRSSLPDIQFITAPADALTVDMLLQHPNVKVVQAAVFVSTRWKIPSGHEPMTVVGLTSEELASPYFNKFELVSGELPQGPNDILMESSDHSVQGFNVGDSIQVDSGGQALHLHVSGIARTRGMSSPTLSGRTFAYMSQQGVQSLFQVKGFNDFLLQLNNYSQREATAKDLVQVLAAHQVVVLNTTVGHDISQSSVNTINGIFGIMQALSVVALVLSIFLLLSTITTLVNEQVPIIGTMKAIGGSRGKVLRTYLTTVAIYGIIGTILGLVLGVLVGELLVNGFANVVTLDVGPLVISPSTIIISLLVGIGVPLLAALLPVYFGTRITVRQALGGYGLENGAPPRGRGWARSMGRVFGFVPQTVQLGARSLFRKRTRAMLTLSALAIAGAAFLCVQTTSYTFNSVLDQVFGAYHADVFVALNNPQPTGQMQATLAKVPGVNRSEPLDFEPITTQWGDGLLTGLQAHTQLYQKTLLEGRWFTDDDQHAVVISNVAAEKTGLKIGDSITFHNSLYSATWTIIGVAKDYNNPTGVGAILAPIKEVNIFKHLPGDYASYMMVGSSSKNQSAIDALASRLDETLSRQRVPATVLTSQHMVQQNQSSFQVVFVLFYSVVVIIALVGAIGLFNALAMSVLERRREIGILRSMGATGGKVAQVFWTEGVSLGVVAWGVALLLGIPAAYGFVRFMGQLLFQMPFAFDPTSLLVMLVFILAVATLASIGPVWGASRVKIAQTLRYE